MKAIFIVVCFAIACSVVRSQGDAVALFNGNNLLGWKVYEKDEEKWEALDNTIFSQNKADTNPTYITTRKEYTEMDLSLEFKQQKGGRASVWVGASADENHVSGWQIVIARPGEYTGGIRHNNAWVAKPSATKEHYLQYGEWNKLRVEVVGTSITTWLNGHKMAEAVDQKITPGKIALSLQTDEETVIVWRKLVLREW